MRPYPCVLSVLSGPQNEAATSAPGQPESGHNSKGWNCRDPSLVHRIPNLPAVNPARSNLSKANGGGKKTIEPKLTSDVRESSPVDQERRNSNRKKKCGE